MKKQVLVTCCSTLVLGAVLSSPAFAAPQQNSNEKQRYVSAQNPQDQAVPKLSSKDVAGAQGGNTPYRLAHSAGLSKKSRVKINGFMSAGVARINSKRAYQIPDHGSVSDSYNFNALSLLGIQFTANLVQNLSVVAQLVANGDNTNGNRAYSVNLDYGYARYQVKGFEFRAGRFRLPAFLYSSTQEIGYTFPWVTLPNEVYRIVPFNNVNGFDTVYKRALGSGGWNYSVEPFVGSGTSKFDLYTSAQPSDQFVAPNANFTENSMLGMVGTLGNKYLTLRGTYVHLKLSGSYDGFLNGAVQHQEVVHDQSDSFYSFGAKLLLKGFMAVGEFAHRNTPVPLADLSGAYGMLGYKVAGFLPNFTYGRLWTTNTRALTQAAGSKPTELAQAQESYTLGIDYYLNSNIVFKGSIGDIRPKDGTRGLFDTVQPSRLKTNNWLYMVDIDAIF
jgi:hypothetical protein